MEARPNQGATSGSNIGGRVLQSEQCWRDDSEHNAPGGVIDEQSLNNKLNIAHMGKERKDNLEVFPEILLLDCN